MSATTDVDPITTAVIGGALTSIAVDMGYRLTRMSYSSIIRESEDFGCAICDHERRQLCESTQSTPLQSGPLPGYLRRHRPALRGGRRRMAPRRRRHPQPPVLRRVAPARRRRSSSRSSSATSSSGSRRRRRTTSTSARSRPGTCGIVDATDAYAEGLLLNAVKVEEEGRPVRLGLADPRPTTRACPSSSSATSRPRSPRRKLGVDRMLELVDRFGLETVRAASEQLMDHSEQALRPRDRGAAGRHATRPSGTLDGFLGHPDPAYHDLPIEVAVTVSGQRPARRPRPGTAPQVDLPINMPLVGTVDIAIRADAAGDPARLDPPRAGRVQRRACSARSRSRAPEGTIANPAFPAPTIARFCPGNVVADTVMRALAQVRPDAVSAGVGNLKVVAYSGQRAGGAWVYMDIVEGSYGGRPDKRRPRRGRHALREHPQQPDRGHRVALPPARPALRAGRGRRRAGRTARRPGIDPRDRVPRGGRRCRSRATATRRGRPGSSAAERAAPAR